MAINKELIKESIRNIIIALGDDPERPGLVETPDRVARMYEEVFEGMNYSNQEIADMFNKTFDEDYYDADSQDLVLVKDIEVFSYCEHHLALMYDMKVSVAYIPNGKVIGLSKIARIADMAAKRLQLQERIGRDIADILSERIGNDIAEIIQLVTGSEDVAVFIEASHSCMTARGIKNAGARTHTQTLRGKFKTDRELLARLF